MLTPAQRALLDAWLPGASVTQDHTWDALGLRAVLELEHDGERYILKAGGPDDGHMAREIRAHHSWLSPWTTRGRVPAYVASDAAQRMLLTRFLPGSLVEGSPAAEDPDTFRQAGVLLRLLHHQPGVEDSAYEERATARSLAWLGRPHRIEPAVEARLREVIATWDPGVAVTLVPTHGDWQPRNWIIHDGVVSAIDLGRADLRPAATDLARLAAGDFRRDPTLEAAFLEGYGPDPRSAEPDGPADWHRIRVREAIGTAVWAYQVGDERFEQQGHRMIAEALADCP